jgi:regulatory protein YycH of two-component signal transduction system YycFG
MQKEKNVQENYFQKVISGEKLLSPVQMIIHADGEHFGRSNEMQLKSVMEELSKNTIINLKDISSNYTDINLVESIRDFKNIELVFADSIPFDVYKKYIKISHKSLLDISFDRIIIPIDSEENAILFVSTENKRVLEAKVDSGRSKEFFQLIDSYKSTMIRVTPIVINHTIIYVPANELKITEKKYFRKIINQKKIEQALFSDSQNLRQSVSGNVEMISDGVSMMSIFLDSLTMTYVKPVLGNFETLGLSEKLSRSIDFVNSHAGWDERYRYVTSNGFESSIRFRLFIDNSPVFNNKKMTEIEVRPGKENIEMYSRPIFYLDFELESPDMKKYTLKSGADVLEQLKQVQGFQIENLQSLIIGYSMEMDDGKNDIVNLVPSWYYKYNGIWNKIEN